MECPLRLRKYYSKRTLWYQAELKTRCGDSNIHSAGWSSARKRIYLTAIDHIYRVQFYSFLMLATSLIINNISFYLYHASDVQSSYFVNRLGKIFTISMTQIVLFILFVFTSKHEPTSFICVRTCKDQRTDTNIKLQQKVMTCLLYTSMLINGF